MVWVFIHGLSCRGKPFNHLALRLLNIEPLRPDAAHVSEVSWARSLSSFSAGLKLKVLAPQRWPEPPSHPRMWTWIWHN